MHCPYGPQTEVRLTLYEFQWLEFQIYYLKVVRCRRKPNDVLKTTQIRPSGHQIYTRRPPLLQVVWMATQKRTRFINLLLKYPLKMPLHLPSSLSQMSDQLMPLVSLICTTPIPSQLPYATSISLSRLLLTVAWNLHTLTTLSKLTSFTLVLLFATPS